MSAAAETAAALWGGRLVRLIHERENAVYEMAVPGGRAALRLHRVGYQEPAAIRSELWWCAALAARGVAVAPALPTLAGSLLAELPGGAVASAIAWVEGAPLGHSGQPFARGLAELVDLHRALGRLLADLHSATDALVLPPDFIRPRWDVAGLVGEAPFWGRFWEHPEAEADDAAVLRRARAWLADRLHDGLDFGPIHADVLRENVLVQDGQVTLIDFDDSGFGFRLYDLGTALSQNLAEAAYPAIRDALIAGYGERRAVTVDEVEMCVLARVCASVGWTMPRIAAGDPVHARQIRRAVEWARRLGV